jgi:hypothetical protein
MAPNWPTELTDIGSMSMIVYQLHIYEEKILTNKSMMERIPSPEKKRYD